MDENDLNNSKSSNNVTADDLGVDEIVYDAINVDAIGFGALNVDKLYKVGHIAEIDGESFIKGEEQSPGGSAANTIIGLSRLGCSTSYIGKIADDEEGDLLEYNLMVNDVYLTNLIYSDGGNSGKVLGFVSDEGDRALYVDPGVNDDISIDEINPLNVNACRILHYTSFVGDSFNAQKELLKILKDDIVLILMNMHWEERHFEMPILPDGFKWKLEMSTGEKSNFDGANAANLMGRSIMAFTGVKKSSSRK